jgi:hypothetical protein
MARDRPRAILFWCDCEEVNVRSGLSNTSNEVGSVKVVTPLTPPPGVPLHVERNGSSRSRSTRSYPVSFDSAYQMGIRLLTVVPAGSGSTYCTVKSSVRITPAPEMGCIFASMPAHNAGCQRKRDKLRELEGCPTERSHISPAFLQAP